MEQLKFLPKLRLTEAQLQKILKDRDYETLDVSNGEWPLMVSYTR